MKLSRKLFSLLLALAVVISAVSVSAVVTTSADTNDADYLTTFSKENFLDWGSYELDKLSTVKTKIPGKITYNADKSIRMESDGLVEGTSAIFKLDSGANDKWKTMVKNTKTGETPKFKVNVYVEKATEDSGKMADTQIVFYAELKDGREAQFTNVAFLDMYCSKVFEVGNTAKIPVLNKDGTAVLDDKGDAKFESVTFTDLSNVTAIKAEMYHWTKMNRVVVMSSPAISGTPSIPAIKPISVAAGVKTATFFKFDPQYKMDYGNGPYAVKYSTDGSSKYTKKATGWAELNATADWIAAQNQIQVYYKFNRDDANYAMAVANKSGNSHYMQVTVQLDSCADKTGTDVMGQIVIGADFYSKNTSDKNEYKDLVSVWQKPGTSATYYFDVSKYDINQIAGVKACVQNYCYYAPDGKTLVDFRDTDNDQKKDTYFDALTGKKYGTATDGKKYTYIVINAMMHVSPITVCEKTPEGVTNAPEAMTTATTKATTTASAIKKVEGAGYRLLPITFDNEDKIFGNSPEQMIITETGKTTTVELGYEKFIGHSQKSNNITVDDFYKGTVVQIKSPTRVSAQHQGGWLVHSSDELEAYGKILSGGPKYDYTDQVEKCLEYAHNSYNLLAVDVKVNSSKHPYTKKECTAQFDILLSCYDELDSVEAQAYVGVGKTETLFFDVTELDASMLKMVRYAAQNYANTNLKTGNACGVTNIDVECSNIYVPTAEQAMKYLGIDASGNKITTKNSSGVSTEVDVETAEVLYNLYKQLPGTQLEDYTTYDQYLILDEFVSKYVATNVETQKYLDTKYGITDMIYSDILWTWQDLDIASLDGYPGFGGSPSTGDTAPVAVLMLAIAAAGAVVITKRRRR